MYDLFLSYAHGADESMIPYAHRIYEELTVAGFNVWIDIYNMNNTVKDEKKIMRSGISSSTIFVALLSPEYMASLNCNFEFSVALKKNKPIVLAAVKSGIYKTQNFTHLYGLQHEKLDAINLTSGHFKKGVEELVSTIRNIY